MGILSLASNTSTWRGYHYYADNHVLFVDKIDENEYFGEVRGGADTPYHVKVNVKNPRKSHCDCPLADGRRVICKHMVALYFSVFPNEANSYIQDIEDNLKIDEQRENEHYEEVKKYVYSLTLDELRSELIAALTESQVEGDYYW